MCVNYCRPQSKPALTDFDLQPNTPMRPWSAVAWSHLRNVCNYMDYYSFTDPRGLKSELAWLADQQRTV